MTIEEAARRLRADYDAAPPGETAASVHLFGIRHAEALKHVSLKEVAIRAGIPASYAAEIAKGVKLAKYVTLKDTAP